MPTYDYRCENGHTFEEFQSMLAAPIEICPICGGKAERQISGGTGLIFKGSGFYITDYGKKGDGKSAIRSHDSKTTVAESTTEKSVDSKPAVSDKSAKPKKEE